MTTKQQNSKQGEDTGRKPAAAGEFTNRPREANAALDRQPRDAGILENSESTPSHDTTKEFIDRAALHDLFHHTDFSLLDGLNEYDDDFTQFVPRSGVITHEMKRVLSRWVLEQQGVAAETTQAAEKSRDSVDLKQAKVPANPAKPA